MIGYQTEILAFAVKWAPYAGGDEHVLPTFGISVEEYYRRLLRLLDSPAARSIDSSTIMRIRNQCMQSELLAHASQGTRVRPVEHR